MADNVAITAGSGTSIAADDISSVFFQRTKQALGPDGTNTGDWAGRAIGSTGVVGWVDPRPYQQYQLQNSAGLTTGTTAYTAGDTLGSGWTFTSMARDSAGSGVIVGATLIDVADVLGAVDVYLFSGSITFGTDNAAPSISDADAAKFVGFLPFGTPSDLGGNRVTSLECSIPYVCDATSLYAYAITRTGHTFFGAVTDVKLGLHFIPN